MSKKIKNKQEEEKIEVEEEKTKEIETIEEEKEETLEKTKIIDVIDDSKIEEESREENYELNDSDSNVKEEVSEENILKSTANTSSNKTIFLIIFLLILIISLIVAIIYFLPKKELEKEKKPSNSSDNEVVLSEEKKKTIINSYGEALEKVVSINYESSKKILTYEEAHNLVKINDDVNCNVHEIYEDGKVYLTECYVNGIKVNHTYGSKQEEKKEEEKKENTDLVVNVYYNKKTKLATLTKPSNVDDYTVYTVNTGKVCSDFDVELLPTDYIFYVDEDYNGHIKNYKTDMEALSGINYSSALLFKKEGKYYDNRYVAFIVNNLWGVYDLKSSKVVIEPKYQYIVQIYGGVTGQNFEIEVLGDTNIGVFDGKNYGVINYTNDEKVIDFEYNYITKSGNYLLGAYDNGHYVKIFDFNGGEYLKDTYDNIYTMVAGIYILVEDEGNIKLVQMDGKVLYDYGKMPDDMGKFNFGTGYNGGLIFQFYKEDNSCIEYAYIDGKGEIKDIACGGVAKPILYLYPEKEMKVSVDFMHPEFLETTYPKYNKGWNVTASVGGNLNDGKNNYYALYWDEKKVHPVDFRTGFYVEGKNAIQFLESKLSYIGLNERERNEFIMYWLPVLEKNEKSLVYFELTEERESYNKINISPKPDSLLRVVIHIKKVDKKTEIRKQVLTKFKRNGFTAVEWGGTTY